MYIPCRKRGQTPGRGGGREMEFTPEEIAKLRELKSRAYPTPYTSGLEAGFTAIAHCVRGDWNNDALDGSERGEATGEYLVEAGNKMPAALDEIERLREALDDAGNAIARVVACCTYGSEEQAKVGAYGISHEAFTEIDAFIRKHGDLLNALKGGE